MVTKVLVIDDSIFIRKVLSEIISKDSRLELVGTANNGREGLDQIDKLHPDVVTLDIEMPIMSGMEMLAILMSTNPKPVILLSSLTKKGARETIQALELGAVDFITKPEGALGKDLYLMEQELKEKLLIAANSKPKSVRRKTIIDSAKEDNRHKGYDKGGVVVIGASTGGPSALSQVINSLPGNIDVPILVVQHMPLGFTKLLADRLNNSTRLSVSEAKDNDLLVPGKILIAPAGYQISLHKNAQGVKIQLTDKSPFKTLFKPSVDLAMLEAVRVYGSDVLGVILTGMGNDGLRGAKAIKSAGGRIIVESEETCVVYGMPKVVVEANLADEVLPLDLIGNEILRSLRVSSLT